MTLFHNSPNNKNLFFARVYFISVEKNKHCTPETREIIINVKNESLNIVDINKNVGLRCY